MASNRSLLILFIFVLGTLISVLPDPVWTQEDVGPDVLTDKEKQLTAKLRPLVEGVLYRDFMKTDEYLARFLRVQNYNIRKAKEAIEDTVKWRKENNIDTALTEDFSLVENDFPVVLEGVDNFGRPLVLASATIIDIRKIVLSGHLQKFLRLFDSLLEISEDYIGELQHQTGLKNITRAIIILDLAGFNLRQHACVQCLPYIPRLFNTYENYYPDMLYRLYILNAPRAFLPVFELIRPFLSEPTRKAVKIFDHNSDNWKRVLLNEIPADQLPTLYGGNRTVVPATLSQLKQKNPYTKAVFEKALERSRKSG